MQSKKVLITGAAGFLGSHLCDRFIKEGYCVIGMDNLITGDLKNIQHLFKNDYQYYWIRFSNGKQKEFLHTFHSDSKETTKGDLLTLREKEILTLIAEDLPALDRPAKATS